MAIQTGGGGANKTPTQPVTPPAPSSTDLTPAQWTTVEAAIEQGVAGVVHGENFQTITSIIQSVLESSGQFTSSQISGILSAANLSEPHGPMFYEQGSSPAPYYASIFTNISRHFGTAEPPSSTGSGTSPTSPVDTSGGGTGFTSPPSDTSGGVDTNPGLDPSGAGNTTTSDAIGATGTGPNLIILIGLLVVAALLVWYYYKYKHKASPGGNA
jgi:LPXTG-motif cell wall-anchored protein